MNDIIAMEGLIKILRQSRDARKLEKKTGKTPISSNNKTKHSNPENQYIILNINELKSEINFDFTPYPKGYFKNNDEIVKQLRNDINKLIAQILASKEYNTKANVLLSKYNSDLKTMSHDEIQYKYTFADDQNYKPLSIAKLKALTRKIRLDSDGYFEIGDFSQEESLSFGIHCEIAELLNPKYVNYKGLDFGDGDEGCVYMLWMY